MEENDEINHGIEEVTVTHSNTIPINITITQESVQLNDEHNETTSIKGINENKCMVCNYAAINKKNAISCQKCKLLVHYCCSKLPPYMLYTYTKTQKRYDCQVCAATPDDFLGELIIADKMCITNDEQRFNKLESCDNSILLETRVSQLCDLVDKYDLRSIADKVQSVYTNLEKANNRFTENVALLNRAQTKLEEFDTHFEIGPRNTNISELEGRLKANNEEVKSLRATENLLLESIAEKDKKIAVLTDQKEKHINIINDMNNTIQVMQNKMHEEGVMESKLRDVSMENVSLTDEIINVNKRITDGDYHLNMLKENMNCKQEIINILKEQLDSLHTTNKSLENNLTLSLENYRIHESKRDMSITANLEPSSGMVKSTERKIVLFHDSLCKGINESIMKNENVSTTKTWAPYLTEIQGKVQDMERVEAIVIESMTRHLRDMETNAIVELAADTVAACLEKADKVIISSLIKRDDEKEYTEKAEKVNVNLRYKYLNDPRVLICSNDNLDERKFRVEDGVHLTDHGTSRFANNLKMKIAEALEIVIEPNPKKNDRERGFFENPRYNRYNHGSYNYRKHDRNER